MAPFLPINTQRLGAAAKRSPNFKKRNQLTTKQQFNKRLDVYKQRLEITGYSKRHASRAARRFLIGVFKINNEFNKGTIVDGFKSTDITKELSLGVLAEKYTTKEIQLILKDIPLDSKSAEVLTVMYKDALLTFGYEKIESLYNQVEMTKNIKKAMRYSRFDIYDFEKYSSEFKLKIESLNLTYMESNGDKPSYTRTTTNIDYMNIKAPLDNPFELNKAGDKTFIDSKDRQPAYKHKPSLIAPENPFGLEKHDKPKRRAR